MKFATIKLYKSLVFFLLIPAILSSCKKEVDEPLRIGLVVWPAYEMAYLAESLGYYDGENIRLIDYGSPAEFMIAYQAESLDAVGTVLDYALQLQSSNPSQRIVLIIDHSVGGDALVVRAPAQTLADIKGQRLGYEASALGGYMLKRALESSQLTPDDFDLVPLDIQNQEAEFRAGNIDGVVTYEPIVTSLTNDGHNVAFDSSQIPFEIVDVLLTNDEISDAKKQKLHTFVQGWFRAVEYFKQNPDDAAKRIVRREGLNVEDFLASFQGIELIDLETNKRFLDGASPELLALLIRHRETMIQMQFLETSPNVHSMPDPRFVRAVDN